MPTPTATTPSTATDPAGRPGPSLRCPGPQAAARPPLQRLPCLQARAGVPLSALPLLVLGVLLWLVGLPGCLRSPQLGGYFRESAALRLAPTGQLPAWTIEAGQDVVLVIYRSEGHSHSTAHTEELVLQLTPAEFATGNVRLEDAGRQGRYQQGGEKLSFASTTLRGTLTLHRAKDAVAGEVTLTATNPFVDVNHLGQVERRFSFLAQPDQGTQ